MNGVPKKKEREELKKSNQKRQEDNRIYHQILIDL